MSYNARLILMFTPLVLAFAGIAVAVGDMRAPRVTRDQCEILGTGEAVTAIKTARNTLYANSNQPVNDIGLQCKKMGMVVLNDTSLFRSEIQAGDDAFITHRQYQYLPERWSVDVKTGKPAEQEL